MTWGPTKKLYNIAQSEYESVCVNLGAEMLSQAVSENNMVIVITRLKFNLIAGGETHLQKTSGAAATNMD